MTGDDHTPPKVRLKFTGPDGRYYFVEAPIPADVAKLFADGLDRIDAEVARVRRARLWLWGSIGLWVLASVANVALTLARG
jgi:hypothetical protein